MSVFLQKVSFTFCIYFFLYFTYFRFSFAQTVGGKERISHVLIQCKNNNTSYYDANACRSAWRVNDDTGRMSEGELGDHRPSARAGTPTRPTTKDRCWRSDMDGPQNLFLCPKGVILAHVAPASCQGDRCWRSRSPVPRHPATCGAFQTLWPTVQGHIVR